MLLDPVKLYFKEIEKIPDICPRELLCLYKRIKTPDENAKKRLVEGNLKLVISIAAKFRVEGISFMDLIEEGNLGLIKAVDKFKEQKGCSFSTYACWWIRQAIRRAIDNQSKTVRIPSYAMENIKKVLRNRKLHSADKKKTYTLRELAKRLHISEKKVNKIMQDVEVSRGGTSLDMAISPEDDIFVRDVLTDNRESSPEEIIDRARESKYISEILLSLKDKQREIIINRFGLDGDKGKTLREIGKKLKISRERVRQIEADSLKKIKRELEKRNIQII